MTKVIAQLKRHEGLKLSPYFDSESNATVGYGTLFPLTEIECAALLAMRLSVIWGELISTSGHIPILTTQTTHKGIYANDAHEARVAVLVNMAYNLGMPRLRTFKKMWAALAISDFDEAAVQMLDSRWARQVKSRAAELAQQMKTGEWS